MDKVTGRLGVLERSFFRSQPGKRLQWRLLTGGLVLLDALCVMLALTAAYKLRIDGWLLNWAYHNGTALENYVWVMLISVPVWLIWARMIGLYTPDNLLGGMIEYKQIVKTCLASIFTLIVGTFWLRDDDFELSRGWILLALGFSIVFMGLARFTARRLVYALRSQGWLSARVLIVGANDQGVAIARQWSESPRSGLRVVGFLDDFKTIGTRVLGDIAVVGRPTALRAAAHEHRIDEVVLVSSAVAWETFGELVSNPGGQDAYTMRLSPGFYQLLTSGMAVTNKTFVPLLTLHPSRIVGIDAWIKSAFDHIVALMALFLTWPAALWIAVWLRLAFVSQPVLRRTRMQGLRGECFELLEFNLDDSTVSLENTRSVMRGIRRAGLQRWPQLFNVLSGQMSMVGPRAIPEGATGHDPAERNNLLAVKPGVLGPWSRHDLTRSPKRVQDELNYVRNWEIWRDIPIVLHAGVALCRRLLTRTE